ncbi:MAG: orotate phosphoribosyltransferase [SAR202 cluster bacterium]|nr:orotate phosphoribosyltransferase [SAR202 cluster bacterium]
MTHPASAPMVRPEVSRAVLALAKELNALKLGDFTLSSGQKSTYYFDGRLLSLNSEGAGILAEVVVDLARRFGVGAVGGPTIGADPIVGAALSLAYRNGIPLQGFLVRSEAKGHGMQRQVEGALKAGTSVMVLDDTCSTGGSLLRSLEAVEAMGCKVAVVFTVLDRRQGGSDDLRRRGYAYVTLLEADASGNVRVVG